MAGAILAPLIAVGCFRTWSVSTAPRASNATPAMIASETGRIGGALATIGGPACVLSFCSRPAPDTVFRVLSNGRVIRTVRRPRSILVRAASRALSATGRRSYADPFQASSHHRWAHHPLGHQRSGEVARECPDRPGRPSLDRRVCDSPTSAEPRRPARSVFLVSDVRGGLRHREAALDHELGRPRCLTDRYSLLPWAVGTPTDG